MPRGKPKSKPKLVSEIYKCLACGKHTQGLWEENTQRMCSHCGEQETEKQMAARKKPARVEKTSKRKTAPASAAGQPLKRGKKSTTKKKRGPKPSGKSAPVKKVTKEQKEKGFNTSRPAGFMKNLLMKGGKTMDAMWRMAQKKFPDDLPDAKKGYLSWCLNDLRKKGYDPPDPKPSK